jgi:hypothetical protein
VTTIFLAVSPPSQAAIRRIKKESNRNCPATLACHSPQAKGIRPGDSSGYSRKLAGAFVEAAIRFDELY